MFSARMKEPMIATIIIIKGLKAVAKTGPLFFITSPCTKYEILDVTIPYTQ